MKIWIVGSSIDCKECESGWMMQGVYKNKKDAIINCLDETFFIGPAQLDKSFPGGLDREPWIGAYYPLSETQEERAEILPEMKKQCEKWNNK